MVNYTALKEIIDAYIKENGNREITGQILNSVLNILVDSLGVGVSKDSTDGECASAKSVYDFVKPSVVADIPQDGLEANIIYNVGVLDGEVEILLASPADDDVMNYYSLIFETEDSVPEITWDSQVTKWAGNCLSDGVPVMKPNRHYEVSISNGVGFILEVA